MKINFCYKCMEKIESYPCPKCGFDGVSLLRAGHELEPGRIIEGKYLVGEPIGQGGFGITYAGQDLALDSKVAIKEFYPEKNVTRNSKKSMLLTWTQDAESTETRAQGLKSVVDEARKLAKVDGINSIVRIRDVFEENNTAYIIMDFIDGETIEKRIAKTGPMKWSELKPLILPVIKDLDSVHKKGLIHRDLSPDNLIINENGEVKILDFGAAKDIGVDGGKSKEVVTNGYSPFEQYTQRGSSGPRSDIYSLAATILFALTGETPPGALVRMESDTINWNAKELKSIPAPVKAAIKKAMSIKADDRQASMAEFLADLEKNAKPPVWIPLAVAACLIAAVGVFMFLSKMEKGEMTSSADTVSNLIEAVVPLEDEVKARHKDDELLIKTVIHPVNGEAYDYETYEYTFDNNTGYITSENITEYDPDGEIKRILYREYDGRKKELCTKYVSQQYSYGTPDNYSYEEEFIYSNGLKTEKIERQYQYGAIYNEIHIHYDEKEHGAWRGSVMYYMDEPSAEEKLCDYEIELNNKGDVVKAFFEDPDGISEEVKFEYIYNVKGDIVQENESFTYTYSYGAYTYNYETYFDNDGNTLKKVSYYPKTYDDIRFNIEYSDYKQEEFTLDSGGKPLESKVTQDDEFVYTVEYVYGKLN